MERPLAWAEADRLDTRLTVPVMKKFDAPPCAAPARSLIDARQPISDSTAVFRDCAKQA
jgi:hypothetical protein